MSEYQNNDVAMSWDDEIQNDSQFTLLPEGDYDFEVVNMERKHFNGSNKMSACPQAVVSFKLFSKSNYNVGTTTVIHNFFLNRKCEGMICAFYTAIGERKHGETIKMDWNNIKGKSGRCKVGIHTWISNDGEEKKSNEIKKFYESAEAPSAANSPRSFVPGKF